MSVKPGCFGSPLCFQATPIVCSECVFVQECETAAQERAARLMEKYNIKPAVVRSTDLRRRALKREQQLVETTEQQVQTIKTDPKAATLDRVADSMLEGLQAKGIDLKGAIARAKNPIEQDQPEFLREAVEALLHGRCTAAHLMRHFAEKFGWAGQTATSFAVIAIKVLQKSGAARSEANRLALVPCIEMKESSL